MFAASVSTAKLNPVAARNQRCVAAKAGKYDEELIKTAVRIFGLFTSAGQSVAVGVNPSGLVNSEMCYRTRNAAAYILYSLTILSYAELHRIRWQGYPRHG